MKIKGDAESSARTGIPTYNVQEEDRSVSWTITVNNLIRFEAWDELRGRDRRVLIENWLRGESSQYEGVMPPRPKDLAPSLFSSTAWRRNADLSMLEQHAIVARNALRNFLGDYQRLAPARKLVFYADPSAGWLGWITFNGKVEAWVTTEGEIIEDARIAYDEWRRAISWVSVDGKTTMAPRAITPPTAEIAYLLCRAIEKIPASPEQTAASVLASDLSRVLRGEEPITVSSVAGE